MDQTFDDSVFIKGPRPWVDVEKKYGLVSGNGQSTAVRTANTVAINAAIADNAETTAGRTLLLNGGPYEINDVIGYGHVNDQPRSDPVVRLHITGNGRTGCRIRQVNDTKNVFDFDASPGNIRGILLENMFIDGGRYGVRLSRGLYNLWRNITFWRCGGFHLENQSGKNHIINNWFCNTLNAHVMKLNAGDAVMTNCLIGEDGGAFESSGGTLTILGCQILQPEDIVYRDAANPDNPNGYTDGLQNMGAAVFTLKGNGQLHLQGNNISFGEPNLCKNLVNMDNGSALVIHGNNIEVRNGAEVLLATRTQTDETFVISNNKIRINGGGTPSAFKLYSGTADPKCSVIKDNVIEVDPSMSCTFDDRILKPELNNDVSGNVIRKGAV